MKRIWRCGVAVLMLSACAVSGKPAPEARYVLGATAPAASAPASLPPLEVSVSALPWLDRTDFYYRLLYADRNRLYHYAESDWAARPASLVAERFRLALPAAAGSARARLLRVELLDFSQHFEAADRSRVELRAALELRDAVSGALLARTPLAQSRPAAPNAAGGAAALGEATDALVAEALQWAARP